MMLVAFSCLFVITCFVNGQGEQTMSFKSPELSEEEQHSLHMPSHMKCDACTAVSYQMTYYLEKEERRNKRKPLKESQLIDLFEKICTAKTFENYGLKSVNGVNRLSGKGLSSDDIPGMMMGGGKWPGRLATKCFEIVGDLSEEEIYEKHRSNKDMYKFLCTEYSSDCKTGAKGKKSEL